MRMINKTRQFQSFALALAFALGSSVVLAKGPGTVMTQGDASLQQRCYPVSGASGATAKSPRPMLTYACEPAGPGQMAAPPGATTAKTLRRVEGPREAQTPAGKLADGPGCDGRC